VFGKELGLGQPAFARQVESEPPPAQRALTAQITTLERFPKWLICVPLTVQWFALALRYGSLTLPTVANPCITAGGLVGEGKLEYLNALGPQGRAACANYFAVGTGAPPLRSAVRRQMRASGLVFPLVVKPNLGLSGYGVRRVNSMGELMAYLAAFLARETVVVQSYLPQPMEAGIFYAREPGSAEGRIIGLALRHFPSVTGDGKRTVGELIAADPRARRSTSGPRHQSAVDLRQVLGLGETARLATIGSTRVGGLYTDGAAHISAPLTRAIDAVAKEMPHFYFGRFDVRFDSFAALSGQGEFTLMEINGAGSEAIEAWDPATPWRRGLARVFAKQRLLFSIAHSLRKQGFEPISVAELARLNARQNRLVASYPPSN
jgi:hypothetical protein